MKYILTLGLIILGFCSYSQTYTKKQVDSLLLVQQNIFDAKQAALKIELLKARSYSTLPPITVDTILQTITVKKASPTNDGYISKEDYAYLYAKIEEYKYKISQLEINMQFTGTQVDINKTKIRALIDALLLIR